MKLRSNLENEWGMHYPIIVVVSIFSVGQRNVVASRLSNTQDFQASSERKKSVIHFVTNVEIHELRGFVSNNLMGALNEIYALSRATRCKQFLFSLSLNPPQNENVSTADFKNAVIKVEKKLGLTDQSRAIVFHEKEGRRHCHAVWSRIKVDEMKAVQLSFTKRKLMELSRELYLQHGWKMPPGLIQSEARDPRNFTHAQWQQAKRIGKDPRQIKGVFQECWTLSDTQNAFASALKEHGYVLARGDQRGFVAVDPRGEVFSISKKWIGINAKDIREKLTDEKSLLSVDEARIQIAKDMEMQLATIFQEQNSESICAWRNWKKNGKP